MNVAILPQTRTGLSKSILLGLIVSIIFVYFVHAKSMEASYVEKPLLKVQIPKTSFLEGFESVSEQFGIPSLSSVNVGSGNLEVRFWSGGYDWQLLQLRRVGLNWNATKYDASCIEEASICPPVNLTPNSSWEKVWQELQHHGIKTLPDSSTLANEVLVLGGDSYVVELNFNDSYRIYHYLNPDSQNWPEAKKFLRIVRLLNKEFLDRANEASRAY